MISMKQFRIGLVVLTVVVIFLCAFIDRANAGGLKPVATDARKVVQWVHPKIEKVHSCMRLAASGADFRCHVTDKHVKRIAIAGENRASDPQKTPVKWVSPPEPPQPPTKEPEPPVLCVEDHCEPDSVLDPHGYALWKDGRRGLFDDFAIGSLSAKSDRTGGSKPTIDLK